MIKLINCLTIILLHCSCLFAAEDDFREVYREVVNIQSSYYQFGIELGLPLREMNAVKKAFQPDIPQAFTEVLRIWLRHRYNVEKYSPPTWRRLVEAVDNPAGGNNHKLAKIIAQHYPVKVVDSPAGGNNCSVLVAKSIPEHHPSATDHEESPSAASESTHTVITTYIPKGSANCCESGVHLSMNIIQCVISTLGRSSF